MAVGKVWRDERRTHAVAEQWNGTGWSSLTVPLPSRSVRTSGLLGVRCPKSTDCEAVGYYRDQGSTKNHAMAERWNGRRWTLQKLPRTIPPRAGAGYDGGFAAVACPSVRECFAVGAGLLERWNGKRWLVQGPRQFGADAVSCSSSRDCWAVGSDFGTSATYAHWNGMRWRVTNPREYDGIFGISCAPDRSCTDVGDSLVDSATTKPLARQWGPGSKSFNDNIPAPPNSDPYDLNGIWCASHSACIAVGGADLVTTWNGTSWSSTTP
jgi:hypothetical protein